MEEILKEIASKIVTLSDESDNDYDLYDNVLEVLQKFYPKIPEIKHFSGPTVFILSTAGTMEWRVDGVFESMEAIYHKLKKDWGLEETFEEFNTQDFREEWEIKIDECRLINTKIKV